MKIRIHSIDIEGYKSIRKERLIFNDRNIICGKHGSGKSSIAEIIFLLFCEEDYLYKIFNVERKISGIRFRAKIKRILKGLSSKGFYITYIFSINDNTYAIRRCFDGNKLYYEEARITTTYNIITDYNAVLKVINGLNIEVIYYLLFKSEDILNKKNIHIIFDKLKYCETFRIQSGLDNINKKYNVNIDNLKRSIQSVRMIIKKQVTNLKKINSKLLSISNSSRIGNITSNKYKDKVIALRTEKDIIINSLDYELVPLYKKMKDGSLYNIFLYNRVKTFIDIFNKKSINYKLNVTHTGEGSVFLLNNVNINSISSYEMAILRAVIKFSIAEMFNYDIIFLDDRYFSSFSDFNFCEIPDSQLFICEASDESGLFIK